MNLIMLLIIFPLLIGGSLLIIKKEIVRDWVIRGSVILIISMAVLSAVIYINNKSSFTFNLEVISIILLCIELIISVSLIFLSLKYKKYILGALIVFQAITMTYYELFGMGKELSGTQHFAVDELSIIMMLIIAVIGGLICLFAIPYMKEYHQHHKEYKDNRSVFFAILFFFLSAMFGIVFSDELTIIYFFWEITTVCSFLLIGYTKTKEARENSFTALLMNMIGGVCFASAIVYLGSNYSITTLSDLISSKGLYNLTIPVIFIAIAAMSKAAQFPFSKWLLGAMVAPTPTSALLHSSTMVKAGVYLLIRLSPLLAGTFPGMMVEGIGGFTFLVTSLMAISESDAKKVLAFSTIANLGLIVACAGIGTYEAVWAAIMLIIFHAVSKSLMFLSVGKTEHLLGSRDIEDMHGLIVKLPQMALLMTVGIAGMFLAPFGMLISKWAALKAFIDSNNIIIVLMLCFGSAATLFYWTKWEGKLVAILPQSDRKKNIFKPDEGVALWALAAITTIMCLIYPIVSNVFIKPYLSASLGESNISIIGVESQIFMSIMLGLIILLPFGIHFMTSKSEKLTTVYMSGINKGDNKNFEGFDTNNKKMYLSSWYMKDYFGMKRLFYPSVWASIAYIIIVSALAMGGF